MKKPTDLWGCSTEPKLTNESQVHPVVIHDTPIPAGANPFHHDEWRMGSDLVRGWMVMHPGFDNKSEPQPLNHIVLVNTRTGQRIRLDFRPIYEYRGLPCTNATHSVAGEDLIKGGAGVLEWCLSEDDAKERIRIMSQYDYQFKALKIYDERCSLVVPYEIPEHVEVEEEDCADDEQFALKA